MAKLYVFGIGGTGSRVIRSLVMMLASGVKLGKDYNEIVPIIIDPDLSNGNKEETLNIIENYNNISSSIKDKSKGFFGTRISSFKGGDVSKKDSFVFKLEGSSQTFKKFIGYDQLFDDNLANKDLVDLLYSEENLNADMKVGFKGNPNIGSVVLNQLAQNDDYTAFLNHFEKGDSIFIISSIFGGTGASGFPTLLKNLRKPNSNSEKQTTVKESEIGALSVLPYFRLDDNDEIDDNTFLTKTKAALDYYSDSILKDGEEALNQMYLIGDGDTNIIPYAVGDAAQKNPSHFIELASAWGVFDFVDSLGESFKIKEFGLAKDSSDGPLTLESLGVETKKMIHGLSKLKLLENYCQHSISDFKNSKGDFKGSVYSRAPEFLESNFYKKELKNFLSYFKTWLDELKDDSNRTIHFNPFKEIKGNDDLLDFIKGKVVKRGFFKNDATGNNLAKAADKITESIKKDNDTGEELFMAVLYDVISEEVKF